MNRVVDDLELDVFALRQLDQVAGRHTGFSWLTSARSAATDALGKRLRFFEERTVVKRRAATARGGLEPTLYELRPPY